MSLPPSVLKNFTDILAKTDRMEVTNLMDTLIANPFIISHKYYDDSSGERKFCLFGILCGLNTDKFVGKSPIDKIRAAYWYAWAKRGNNRVNEDILPIEEYIKNRFLQGPKAGAKPLLSKAEVDEIINICKIRLRT